MVLTARLPDGGRDRAALTGRSYSRDELEFSQDDMLECAECGIVIDPGGEMTYLVGTKEGFFFYHPGRCADVALVGPPDSPMAELVARLLAAGPDAELPP